MGRMRIVDSNDLMVEFIREGEDGQERERVRV